MAAPVALTAGKAALDFAGKHLPRIIVTVVTLAFGAIMLIGTALSIAASSSAASTAPTPGVVVDGWTHPLGEPRMWWSYIGTVSHQLGAVDFPVPSGTPVYAAADGVILEAGWGGAYGEHILIEHGDGSGSLYAHLSFLQHGVGTTVTAGQLIGLSGNTGYSTGPHVHFEIRAIAAIQSTILPGFSFFEKIGLDLGPCWDTCQFAKRPLPEP